MDETHYGRPITDINNGENFVFLEELEDKVKRYFFHLKTLALERSNIK
jgi:hypothetical protein